MKRSLAVLLSIGLVAGALFAPAHAAKRSKRRVETATYILPAIGSADVTGSCVAWCVRFMPKASERYLSLKIEDASGQTPAATVGQDLSPDDQFVDRVGEICGETTAPLAITPGVEIIIWVWATPSSSCTGIGTTGTVTATFSAQP